MNRQEENKILIEVMAEKAKNNPEGTYQEMVTFQLSVIASMLIDISKSLAIIADKEERNGL